MNNICIQISSEQTLLAISIICAQKRSGVLQYWKTRKMWKWQKLTSNQQELRAQILKKYFVMIETYLSVAMISTTEA